jgi:hypothetical protein
VTSKKTSRKSAASVGAAKAGSVNADAKRAGAKKAVGAKKTGAKKKTGAAKVSTSKAGAAKAGAGKRRAEVVDGGRYVLIDGRRWRATDPSIPEEERQRLVNELMKARRDVGSALRAGDADAEREARGRVNRAKVALGERGAKWWEKNGKKVKTQDGRGAGKEADGQ